jgi:hypothetical protein
MRRALLLALPVAGLLLVTTGCDVAALPAEAKAILSAKADWAGVGDQLMTRTQTRLQDGTCDGDMLQYRLRVGDNGGGNGGIGGGNGSGAGTGDQLRIRLRDGSCGDGG